MVQLNRRIALVATLGALALAGGSATAAVPTGDMSLGNPKAKVKMVEYASLSCGHCAAFNNDVFPAFKKKYIDTSKVHYTLREILTPPTELAAAGFMLARCAGADKYFAVVDDVFKSHGEMAQTGNVGGVLRRVARDAGLDDQQFQACITDKANLDALNARVEKATTEGGITGTPTFFFNGKKAAEGGMTAAQLDEAVAQASK